MASGVVGVDRGGFIRPVGSAAGLLVNHPASSFFCVPGRIRGGCWIESLGNHSAITERWKPQLSGSCWTRS